ncbi:hypothetical protein [Pseudomonas aeruginosa]|uniref:hypothetical protein n=1 Tax=Pseudomonas aeruginosa TaxID=287 RepID=UPI001BDDB617|nr:hypothetical protein [Pseudomonas aeruginosa]MBT1081719.1 hypothetical protein [Pseudomonas aeruginosa]
MKYDNKFKQKHRNKHKIILTRIIQILSSLGAFSFLIATSYSFFMNDIRLTFERPYGRSYIFSFSNDNPADIRVEQFRVTSPNQPVIAKTTRDIYAESRDGSLVMPGGNVSTVPITEFHELDGETIPSHDIHKFRLPPLNSRDYLRLEAAIFEIDYKITPKSKTLSFIDKTLKLIGLRNESETIRYLVIDNYWIPTRSPSPYEAIRVACRDNDMLSKDLCSESAFRNRWLSPN